MFHVRILGLDRRSGQVKPEPASGSSGPSKSAAISADLMTIWKEYYRATSITDALHALAAAQGPARVIAGGTDILLDLQQERLAPLDRLVDINSIPEMQQIEIRDGQLTIGAAVPLSQVVAHSLVREHAQALVEAGSLIGGPQVRNQATLGGNVAHALPAADGSIALLAHGALADIASMEGTRRVPIQTVYAGPGRSALRTGLELLVGFQPAAAWARGGGGIPAGDAPARGGAAGIEPGGVVAPGGRACSGFAHSRWTGWTGAIQSAGNGSTAQENAG